jgi:hypothetical protein
MNKAILIAATALALLPAKARAQQAWHYHDGGCTATGTSSACFTPSGSLQFVTVRNEDPTNAVACAIANGTAAINTPGSVTLQTTQVYTWFFPGGLPIPAGAINCISASTSSPIHFDVVSNP